MAIFFYLQNRIRRGIAGGLAITLLLGTLCWFSCLFYGFIDKKAQEIENAYDVIPVTVVVSNLQGTQTDHLEILDYLINYFVSDTYAYGGEYQLIPFSSYVKEICLKTTLYYGKQTGDATQEVSASSLPPEQRLVGITMLDAASELAAAEGITVTYFSGSEEELFRTDEPVCIVSRKYMDELTPDADGICRISLSVQSAPQSIKATAKTLKVVGSYSGSADAIYCPWNVVAVLQKQLDGQLAADRLSAVVRDNRKLDEFRTLLERHFAEVDPSGRQKEIYNSPILRYQPFAATVHDETLRQTLNELNRNLQMLNRLLPLVISLVLTIGFFSCFYYVQTRKREMAVARSLGTRRGEVLLMLFIEAAIWGLLGAVLALAVYLPTATGFVPYAVVTGIVLAALAGTVFSGLSTTGRKGMRSIKEED
jgi:hypothetical protein